MVARIAENGGVVIKVEVQHRGAKGRTSTRPLLHFHQYLEDFRGRINLRSQQTYGRIIQLKKSGIEILNSQIDRTTFVAWIWCRSQVALVTVKKLYESNQLREILPGLADIQPSSSDATNSIVFNVDCNQFQKTVVVCPMSITFSEFIDIPRQYEVLRGVTKLRNKIYVLSQEGAIRVFEDRNPFRLLDKIELKQFTYMLDIVSSVKGNCLYVVDGAERCVFKITEETDGQHCVIKWLTTDYFLHQVTLSVSSLDNLLIVGSFLSHLNIYGSNAEHRSIQLPKDIEYPGHAVETSIGNFIILHQLVKKDEEGAIGKSRSNRVREYVVSELTRDGQMVIRRFIPSNEMQELIYPAYLALDSDDQVFVADSGKDRIVFLDSDLKWNRIICPTKQEDGIETNFQSIYCDEEKKQLICTGYSNLGLNVYTLRRK